MRLDPTLKEAHYQLGLAYRRLGAKEKAAQALGRFGKLKQADNLAETERQGKRTIEDRSGGSVPQPE